MRETRHRRILCQSRMQLFMLPCIKKKGPEGGHIILLNSADSEYFQATKAQAMLALGAYPGGLQIGGGVNPDNAADYLACWSQSCDRHLLCVPRRSYFLEKYGEDGRCSRKRTPCP